AAAIGTSIGQAAPVAGALESSNWDLIRHASELGEPWKVDAAALHERLTAGLAADELAVPMVARLREATTAATDLLARATQAPEPPGPGPGPSPEPVPGGFNREAAEEHLQRIRERLRAEAHLDLSWQITDLDDDASS